MASSLDSLYRNLVGVNGIACKKWRSEAELIHIDENYIAHRMCGKCRGASNHKSGIDPIFNNLSVRHTDEQFQMFLSLFLLIDGQLEIKVPR